MKNWGQPCGAAGKQRPGKKFWQLQGDNWRTLNFKSSAVKGAVEVTPEENSREAGQEQEQEREKAPVMACRCSCTLLDESGAEISSGEATLELWREEFVLLPLSGATLALTYREIMQINPGDYRIGLSLASGEKILLFDLGYNFEDCLRILYRLRGEVILKDMLMQEKVIKAGLQGEYRYEDEKGALLHGGPCEPRVYETALVVIPQVEDPLRIPFADIEEVAAEDYALAVITSAGHRITFFMMGPHLDPFAKALAEARHKLNQETGKTLQELLPAVEPSLLRKAAALLRDGKAASRREIEAISPVIWEELEKKIVSSSAGASYNYLKALGQQERICIGIKKGLLGDLSGLYLWFLIPIYSTEPDKPGNAVAMKSFSAGEGGGQATYFFRLMSRGDYRRCRDLSTVHREAEALLKEINRGMLSINFRREPVYLPDERLREPRYLKYFYAVNKLPALRELRARFIGRVTHSSPEQWREDVYNLLRFNSSAENDDEVWRKEQR